MFEDADALNFKLETQSPAIDAGDSDAIEAVCERYEQLYGINLRFDFDLSRSSARGGWDIGPMSVLRQNVE